MDFYYEVMFYEQWWVVIDLALLALVALGAALASYRRPHLMVVSLFGFGLCYASVSLMVTGILLAWNLPFEIVEVYSQEVLRSVRNLPTPREAPNYMNYIALFMSFLMPVMGWKVAKFTWLFRRESSTYLARTAGSLH